MLENKTRGWDVHLFVSQSSLVFNHVLSSGFLPQDWRLAWIFAWCIHYDCLLSHLDRLLFSWSSAHVVGSRWPLVAIFVPTQSLVLRLCRFMAYFDSFLACILEDGQYKRCKVKADIFFLGKSKDILCAHFSIAYPFPPTVYYKFFSQWRMRRVKG